MNTTPSPRPRETTAGRPRTSRASSRGGEAVHVRSACTIRRPAGELYRFWRDLENIGRVVKHPISIIATPGGDSHWSVSAPPGDRRVEWDAAITADEPDARIAWRSREGSEIPNEGSIRFIPAPGDEGTEVHVDLHYRPPGGKLGAWLAKLSGEEGAQQVAEALRRFKALMEAGEIPTTRGQPVGEPQRSRQDENGKEEA